MPDLWISQLWLLGQAGEEQVEQLLVHVVAHLVQDEPANLFSKFAKKVNGKIWSVLTLSPWELLSKKDFREIKVLTVIEVAVHPQIHQLEPHPAGLQQENSG